MLFILWYLIVCVKTEDLPILFPPAKRLCDWFFFRLVIHRIINKTNGWIWMKILQEASVRGVTQKWLYLTCFRMIWCHRYPSPNSKNWQLKMKKFWNATLESCAYVRFCVLPGCVHRWWSYTHVGGRKSQVSVAHTHILLLDHCTLPPTGSLHKYAHKQRTQLHAQSHSRGRVNTLNL